MPISRAFLVASFLTVLASAAVAQPQTQLFVSGGTAGPGDTEGWASHVTGGAERIGRRGEMLGGDAALVSNRTSARPGHPRGERYVQFIGSVYAGLHLLPAALNDDIRFDPFVTAGMSLVTDPDCCGPSVGWNLGAGATVWVNDRIGIRVDGGLIRALGGEGGLLRIGAGLAFRRWRR